MARRRLGGIALCLAALSLNFVCLKTTRRWRSPRAAEETEPKVSAMKVPELRAELRALGLDDRGVRRVLLQRLSSALAEPGKGETPVETLEVLFVANASVGHMARVVRVGPELLVLGDFTGKSSGLDPDTGYVRWSSSSGLESISNTKVVDDMVLCASAWTGNVSGLRGDAPQWSLDANVGEYARVAWSPSASMAIFGGGGGVHRVAAVDLQGTVRYSVDAGIGAVWSVCSAGSAVLCGGSWARPEHTAEVACLDVESGELRFRRDPKVGRYIVTALAPKGAFCAGENGKVTRLEPSTGEVLFQSSSEMDEVWGLEVADELLLCSGGWSEQMSALDQSSGELRWGPVNATVGKIFSFLVVPPDGLVICGGSLGRVSGLDLATGRLRFAADLSDLGEVWSLTWHEETRRLYCGGNKERVAAVQL